MTAPAVAPLSSGASRRCLAITFAVGLVLTASTVVVSTIPDLRFAGWPWTLAGVAALAVGLATPVHRHAAAELGARRVGVAALAVLGLLVSLVATVHQTVTDDSATMAVAVVASAALLSLVLRWRGDESIVEAPTWFTPAVTAAALGAGVAWSLAASPGRGLTVAALLLVAAGPGALLAASPAALRVARRSTAQHHVALPHPSALSQVAAADVALLDKDGTVTSGALRVTAIDPVEPDHERNLRWFAGALEHEHEGRVARAISRLSGRGRVTELQRHADVGVSGRVDRHPVRVGDLAWLGLPAHEGVWTTVGVEVDARVLGTLTVGDDVRADAAEGVQALRDLGLDVALRSGDTDARTREVAAQVGIDDAAGDADAENQRGTVAAWTDAGRRVLHVSTGSTLTADLGLVDLDVGRVARAVRAARGAVRSARRGQSVALVWSVLAGAAAAAGLLGPGLAGIAAGVGVAATVVVAGS
ncbi:HAD family hydrolase [Aeromicrobium sp. 50.2.37]|uniref:HAD family hydrolase n=1 Tax=Aeromicrobium sp. 50.2.37 TaxID=2969305 RepID=UPI00215067A1|nr:HAD family hydrolase [Aeromicrobium sp. 50.2.37]MCR4513359.1 HAD family hydrolase [Aeromicrobium sp. 50.2.37]